MKKIITLIVLITLIMLFPITSKALTKVNLLENSNGKLNTTLHFEEGFVGGIDLKLKITGNVEVKTLSFNDKIKENNYTTKYDYDAKNKILDIKITTGGKGSNHNLLNSKKELSLGTITFSTKSKENVKYSFSIDSLTIVDNNLDSQVINKEHLTFGDTKEFTYIVNKEEIKEDDKKEEESKQEENTEKDDNNQNDNESTNTNSNNDLNINNDDNNAINSSNSNTNNTNNTNSNKNNTSSNKDKDKNKEETNNNDLDDENITDKEENNDNELSNNNSSNFNNLIYWFLAFAFLAVLIVIIIIVLINKKKNKAGN